MIKFFGSSNLSHMILDAPLLDDDVDRLRDNLGKDFHSWHVEFVRIYSVDLNLIQLLYDEIFNKGKNIKITTHKSKLNRYFHEFGFKSTFDSLIKRDLVDIENIKVVLIGGSANSSEKIIEIVKNISLTNLTLVLVQHVEPDRVGIFDTILQKYTKHHVSYAKDCEKLLVGRIYLAPNNKHLKIVDGFFHLSDEAKYNYSKPSVSISYESFSNYYKDKLLVIQECGYASDGVDKLSVLKTLGSKLIIQDIDECEAKPMVQNAIDVKLHDYILKTKYIIDYINIVNNKTTAEAWLEYLFDKVKEIHNYDFKLYHKDMLKRRLDVFMIKNGIKSIKNAIGIILFNKNAFKTFFLEVSINVTELFRNQNSFNSIAKLLKKEHKHKHNIKIWSAGCSRGDEPYSLAMMLDTLDMLDKSIIYATDFNNVIIQEAKNGLYSNKSYLLAQENISKLNFEIDLDKYFYKNRNFLTINEKIKEKILFFQHNLVEDSSFNEFEIIICKNVIIYFDDNLQKKVFSLLYESLKFGGYLVLGESEHIHSSFVGRFIPHSDECKIFKKIA
jgi:chemotaxis protein methyltransferase CheR